MESQFTKKTSVNVERSGTHQSSEDTSNAMLNQVVLCTFFDHVTFKDLKVFRKVCKTWWKVSLTRWRRDAWMCIQERRHRRYSQSLGLSTFVALSGENNPEDPLQLNKHPFQKFKLDNWNMDRENPNKLKFWNKFGTTMTHLSIQNCSFYSKKSFRTILYEYVPNLEYLELKRNIYEIETDAELEEETTSTGFSFPVSTKLKELRLGFRNKFLSNEELPVSFLEFFSRCTNITSLELKGIWTRDKQGEAFFDILGAMLVLAKDHGVKWELEKLDLLMMRVFFMDEFEMGNVQKLHQLQLPLTSLSLDIGRVTPAQTFKIILESYASTLRKLVVLRNNDDILDPSNSHAEFPFGVHLDSLLEMRMLGTAVLPNLHFLSFTPKLRSLYLVYETANNLHGAGSLLSDQNSLDSLHRKRQLSFGNKYPYPTSILSNTDFSQLETVLPEMEEFIVCGKHYQICSPREIKSLTKLMPNLKKLRLGFGNDGFRVVCDAWKELELLIIQPCEVDESGILGTIPGLNIQLPSLVDLSHLRHFAFERKGNSLNLNIIPEYFGRVFVMDEFEIVNAIKDLKAIGYDQIRDEALHEFKTKFPDCTVVSFESEYEEWRSWEGPEESRSFEGEMSARSSESDYTDVSQEEPDCELEMGMEDESGEDGENDQPDDME